MFCYHCGKPMNTHDRFCPNCGAPARAPRQKEQTGQAEPPSQGSWQSTSQGAGQNRMPQTPPGAASYATQGAASQAAPGARQTPPPSGAYDAGAAPGVQYVYVDPATGRVAKTPPRSRGKSGSETFMQWMTVAFIAVGMVILMVAASLFISGCMVRSVFTDNVVSDPMQDFLSSSRPDAAVSSRMPVVTSDPDEHMWGDDASSDEADASEDVSSVSGTVSSAPRVTSRTTVSSRPVSSVPETQRASYLKKYVKGSWTTEIPYKAMSLPATFRFDGKGKCSCELKALFITKKFEGTYTVKDGGKCTITLEGLDDYVEEGNTLEGDLEVVRDDQMKFTVGDTVWILNRK